MQKVKEKDITCRLLPAAHGDSGEKSMADAANPKSDDLTLYLFMQYIQPCHATFWDQGF